MSLFKVKNECGFISGFDCNERALKVLPVYTADESKALVMTERYFHYFLNYKLSGFDYHASTIITVDNSAIGFKQQIEQFKPLMELSKSIDTFLDNCHLIKKVNYINGIRADIMATQNQFIEFFTTAKFKTDGSLFQKFKPNYDLINDSVKSNIRWEWCGGNIWVTFRRGDFQHTIYVILRDNDPTQKTEQLEPLTIDGFKKAMVKIKSNSELINTLQSEITTLKSDFYL
ncbi:hypothetical protein NVP1083O_04 [Vibrio phage 1.083.O._10N.286.52.B9]|nr:hypothetical protein NVP1083O_04 [Vibrio phage 1.083.O._10N.286.52.B9]